MAENLGLRSRKKLAARRALRSAAVRLVIARGLKNVTVEDIAAEADVSVRTFFNYFSSKEEAIVGPSPEVAAELRLALLARPAEEVPLVALQAVLIDLAIPYADRQEDWLLHMQVVRQEPTLLPSMLASFSAQERSLVEAVAERTATDPDRDLYPALVAAVAIAAFRVAMTHWRTRKGERSLSHLVEAAMTRVQAGLTVPESTVAALRMGIDGQALDPDPPVGDFRPPRSSSRQTARS